MQFLVSLPLAQAMSVVAPSVQLVKTESTSIIASPRHNTDSNTVTRTPLLAAAIVNQLYQTILNAMYEVVYAYAWL